MSKTRGDIEAFGIDAVSSVIRKGQHLSPQLNKNEKTPSYDGYVSIINNQTGKIEDEIGRVFVQVKTRSKKRKQEKDRLFHCIERKYLENYQKNYPLIFFVVHKYEDDSYCIYYKELQKIDLFNTLKTVRERYQIEMKRLRKTPEQLDDLFLHFYNVAKTQEMIVPEHQISIADIVPGNYRAHLRATSFYADGSNFFSIINDGNLVIYCERDNILYHVNTDGMKLDSIKTNVDCTLTVNDRVFFTKAEIEQFEGKVEYRFSDSISITIVDGKRKQVSLDYHISNRLNSLLSLMQLIVAINETGYCEISLRGKTETCYLNSIPPELLSFCTEKLPKLESLKRLLSFFHVDADLDVSRVGNQDYMTAERIRDSIEKGDEIELSGHKEDSILAFMNLAEHRLAFLAIRQQSGLYKMLDVLGDKKNRSALLSCSDGGKQYIVPIETGLREPSIWSCANFNCELYLKTLERLLANDSELSIIINDYDFLSVLREYDKSKKHSLLALAGSISSLLEKCGSGSLYVLNTLQVVKRQRLLTEEEKNKLIDVLSCDEPVYKIAACLLLDRKDKAQELLNSISEEEQKGILDYPISVFLS